MGAKGNGEGAPGAFVLDAGALIAIERPEKQTVAFLEQVLEEGDELLIPASALAQVWRGGPRSARLARLIASTTSDALDEARAKEVGERLGSRDKADVIDAHVVCCAIERDAGLLTADQDDIEALIEPGECLTVIFV